MKRNYFVKQILVGVIAGFCSVVAMADNVEFTKTLTGGGAAEMNYSGGNVGIGTETPDFLLEAEQFATEPHIVIHNTGSNGGATFRMIDDLSGADWKFKAITNGGFKIRDHANGRDTITIEPQLTATGNAIYIDSNGNVGIGTTTTTIATALSVNGTIESKEINVQATSTSWPDYVFMETYKLWSLEEVEKYTQKHKHLPGVPSQDEVAKNGISLGEISSIQMEKIEELTLYVIALQKQNMDLNDRLRLLEERL